MRMRAVPRSELWVAEDGVSTIEFGFVAGLLCILVLGMLDFGVGFWEQMQVNAAAQAGIQYVMKHGYGNAANIQSASTDSTGLSGITATTNAPSGQCGCPSASVGVSFSACGSTCPDGSTAVNYITVTAQASYSPIFSWPGLTSPMTLSATAVVRN